MRFVVTRKLLTGPHFIDLFSFLFLIKPAAN